MHFENFVGPVLVALVVGYWIYHTRVIRRSAIGTNEAADNVRRVANEQDQRTKHAIEVSQENTRAALRQNETLAETNALLKELIAVNRQLLENNKQADL